MEKYVVTLTGKELNYIEMALGLRINSLKDDAEADLGNCKEIRDFSRRVYQKLSKVRRP